MNEYLSEQWQDHVITEMKDGLPDAEEWKTREKSEQDVLRWDVGN